MQYHYRGDLAHVYQRVEDGEVAQKADYKQTHHRTLALIHLQKMRTVTTISMLRIWSESPV